MSGSAKALEVDQMAASGVVPRVGDRGGAEDAASEASSVPFVPRAAERGGAEDAASAVPGLECYADVTSTQQGGTASRATRAFSPKVELEITPRAERASSGASGGGISDLARAGVERDQDGGLGGLAEQDGGGAPGADAVAAPSKARADVDAPLGGGRENVARDAAGEEQVQSDDEVAGGDGQRATGEDRSLLEESKQVGETGQQEVRTSGAEPGGKSDEGTGAAGAVEGEGEEVAKKPPQPADPSDAWDAAAASWVPMTPALASGKWRNMKAPSGKWYAACPIGWCAQHAAREPLPASPDLMRVFLCQLALICDESTHADLAMSVVRAQVLVQ